MPKNIFRLKSTAEFGQGQKYTVHLERHTPADRVLARISCLRLARGQTECQKFNRREAC